MIGALEVGIVAFLLRAQDALQLPFTSFLYGDLSPFAHDTRFGEAFVAMELGFAVVAALLFLAWLTERRWLLWPAFLLSLGLGSGLSLSSHQSDDRGWLPSFADWVHLSAATLWIGGLLSLGARRLAGRAGFGGRRSGGSRRSPGRSSRSSSRRAST